MGMSSKQAAARQKKEAVKAAKLKLVVDVPRMNGRWYTCANDHYFSVNNSKLDILVKACEVCESKQGAS
jgi:hypothetical protein